MDLNLSLTQMQSEELEHILLARIALCQQAIELVDKQYKSIGDTPYAKEQRAKWEGQRVTAVNMLTSLDKARSRAEASEQGLRAV